MASWNVISAKEQGKKPEINWICDKCEKVYHLKIENDAYKEIGDKYYFMYLRYFVYPDNTEVFIDICCNCSNVLYNESKQIKAVYALKQRRIKNENSSR